MTALRGLFKAGALRLVEFVVARPALDAFLRRQVYRFPGVAGRARAAVARSRRAQQNMPADATDEADLSDAARQVLHDLARAIAHPRLP